MFAQPVARQPVRQWTTWPFNDRSGRTLVGYSRSTERTFFHIKELGVGLDAGGTRGIQPPFVFVTHSHRDHAIDLPWVARRPGVHIYLPHAAVEYARAHIRADMELNNCAPLNPDGALPYTLHGVRAGDELHGCLGPKHPHWSVRVFACTHGVPCVGYAFQESVTRLAARYRGMPGAAIKALRDSGEAVSESVAVPRFAYVGDTSIRVFADNPWLADYPIVIVECTFLGTDMDGVDLADRCARHGHICWPQLAPVVAAHPATTFVLIHFSLRYTVDDVVAHFANVDAPNIVVNVGEHRGA